MSYRLRRHKLPAGQREASRFDPPCVSIRLQLKRDACLTSNHLTPLRDDLSKSSGFAAATAIKTAVLREWVRYKTFIGGRFKERVAIDRRLIGRTLLQRAGLINRVPTAVLFRAHVGPFSMPITNRGNRETTEPLSENLRRTRCVCGLA